MKNKKCRICQKEQKNDDKYIEIKEKLLYDGESGYWYNFSKAIICWNCVLKLREEVSQVEK